MIISLFMQTGMKLAIILMVIASLLPWLCSVLAKISAGFRFAKHNQDPRGFLADSTGITARFNHAQVNGYETLPVFLAAVLIAIYTFVPMAVVNLLAAGYVLFRIGYIASYAANLGMLRSVNWLLSMLCVLGLFAFAFMVGV